MRFPYKRLLTLVSLPLFSLFSPLAYPANGDLVGTVHFSIQCTSSGLGVGIAFDGNNLWYSCWGNSPDLLRANPRTGQVTASYTIAGGLGALAYDGKRNAIWAGWGGPNSGSVYLINLDANKNVSSSAIKFNSGLGSEDIDDGFAYDGQDDTFYISPDTSTTIYHYSINGTLLDTRSWAGNSCYNSGLAIGGNLLYQGSDGCSKVWVTDKKTNALQFTFGTVVAGDPNFRDEGLGCDISTFAAQGKHVMWSKEAYTPQRASAFEIPFGTCGSGGQLVGITSIDPVPNLLSGASVTSNTDQLATVGRPVTGVSADGITNVVIRIPATSVNEPFLITLLNDQGFQSSSSDGDGLLGSLATDFVGGGGSNTVHVSAVNTIAGPMAFVLYRAPIDFVRANSLSDSPATKRTVSLKVQAIDTSASATVALNILRPPVVLIHGLWGDPSNWNSFTPLVSDSRFSISRVNYNIQYVTIAASVPSYDASILSNATNNTLGFEWNANHIITQIKAAINSYKQQESAAAVQADIVAHSMGGDISRTLPLKSSFSSSDNYSTGFIHKLITVGTPHLGTPVASRLLEDGNKCVRDLLADPSNGSQTAFTAVTVLNTTINGAVGDLVGDVSGGGLSNALKNIKNATPRFWTAMIAGVMSAGQLNGLGCGPFCHAAYIRFHCKGSSLADNLTVAGWPTIVGQSSDSIVPLNSQVNGNTSVAIQMMPAIHSRGMESLDFLAPSELDSGSGIPDKVITLLNTAITTTGTFVKQ
jgi:pimeloyl-ACP methyl ester carboxylesterase